MCFASEGIGGTRPCRHVQRQSLDKNKTFNSKEGIPQEKPGYIWHDTKHTHSIN